MAVPSPQDQPDAAHDRARDNLLGAWRLMVAALIGLLGFCGYWIVTLGFDAAIATERVQYAAFAAVFIGIASLIRFLPARYVIDARSARTGRRYWPMRPWRRLDDAGTKT